MTKIESLAKIDKANPKKGPIFAMQNRKMSGPKQPKMGITPSPMAAPVVEINLDTRRILKDLRRLSEECILSLRLELRLWAFVYTDGFRRVRIIFNSV